MVVFSCKKQDQDIINQAISRYGGSGFENCEIEFDFRDKHYKFIHKNGKYSYSRIFNQDTVEVIDVLDNESFQRTMDGVVQDLDEKKVRAYSNSVNSVAYFALLPYKLGDPAVRKEYLGQETIKDQDYHKFLIYFDQNEGGEDFEDRFVYWFSEEELNMDYFAYSYDTEEKGLRFRAAKNKRRVGELVFQDYENFKADPESMKLEDLGSLYNSGKLELLSTIDLENIEVKSPEN